MGIKAANVSGYADFSMNIMIPPSNGDGVEKQDVDESAAPSAAKMSLGAAVWTIIGLSMFLWMIVLCLYLLGLKLGDTFTWHHSNEAESADP